MKHIEEWQLKLWDPWLPAPYMKGKHICNLKLWKEEIDKEKLSGIPPCNLSGLLAQHLDAQEVSGKWSQVSKLFQCFFVYFGTIHWYFCVTFHLWQRYRMSMIPVIESPLYTKGESQWVNGQLDFDFHSWRTKMTKLCYNHSYLKILNFSWFLLCTTRQW